MAISGDEKKRKIYLEEPISFYYHCRDRTHEKNSLVLS